MGDAADYLTESGIDQVHDELIEQEMGQMEREYEQEQHEVAYREKMARDEHLESLAIALESATRPCSVLTHNGKFTVKSIRTGDHRTFQVKTQPQDSDFAPGKRVLSLLTGPDNQNSYTGFAFVDEFGVHVWSKKKTPTYIAYAAMLERLQTHVADGKVEVYAETRCRVCNRTLTTPESVVSGIGPVCEGR